MINFKLNSFQITIKILFPSLNATQDPEAPTGIPITPNRAFNSVHADLL